MNQIFAMFSLDNYNSGYVQLYIIINYLLFSIDIIIIYSIHI